MLPAVDEILIFLNGMDSRSELDQKVPLLQSRQWLDTVRIITSPENRPLGLAIREMVRLAKNDLVLLLEKDWALIENAAEVRMQLSVSSSLIEKGTAHVVRFRHRHRPGAPLHARIMHDGREEQMLQQQSNLFCYLHHWVDNPLLKYRKYFKQCKGSDKLSERVWCSKARFCQWTNNPSLFNRKWFMDKLGDPFEQDYYKTKKQDPKSGMLDFEFYTNWNNNIWNNKNYIVALPRGLFEHEEIGEQNVMNTVWYAWLRLSTDVEEKQRIYFATEAKECRGKKSHESGIAYQDKYPIDFARLYHYERAMSRSVDEAVTELGTEAAELRNQLTDGHGSWRHGVTGLTEKWYKTVLYTYPVEPKDMKISFVTAIYAVEGTDVGASGVSSAAANLNRLRHYALVVYTDQTMKDRVRTVLLEEYKWSEKEVSRIRFVIATSSELVSRMLTQAVVDRIEELRSESEWKTRVAQRSGGSIPSLTEVGLLLAKPLLLRDAEQLTSGRNRSVDAGNLQDVTHLVWVDAWSRCLPKAGVGFSGSELSLVNDHVLRGNMLLNCMVSGSKVSTNEELEIMLGAASGFDKSKLLKETELQDIGSGLSVVDGRTIGGSRLAITLMAGYYDVVMLNMLNLGHLGSEREPLTIALKNVDYNFRFVDAWHICPDNRCKSSPLVTGSALTSSDSGCRIFEWASRCAIR